MLKVIVLSIFAVSFCIGQEIPIKDVHNVDPANIACTIDIHTQTASPQPVYLRPGTNQPFYPATRAGQMQFTANQAVRKFIKFKHKEDLIV